MTKEVTIRKATWPEWVQVMEGVGLDPNDTFIDADLLGAKYPENPYAIQRIMVKKGCLRDLNEDVFGQILGAYVYRNAFAVHDVEMALRRLNLSARRVLRFKWFWKAAEKVMGWRRG